MRLLLVIPFVFCASCCTHSSNCSTHSSKQQEPTTVFDDSDEDDFLKKSDTLALDVTATSKVDDDAYLDWPDRYDKALNEQEIADGDYDEEDVDDEAEKESIENMNEEDS